jgi:hypothetical protein
MRGLIAPDHEFTEEDVYSALECYDKKYCTFPIEDIEKTSGIQIKRNKRNYQPQEWHLQDIRTKKENMKKRGQAFKAPEGRPKKADEVREWREAHPNGTKAECNRETNIDPKTIRKWWNA